MLIPMPKPVMKHWDMMVCNRTWMRLLSCPEAIVIFIRMWTGRKKRYAIIQPVINWTSLSAEVASGFVISVSSITKTIWDCWIASTLIIQIAITPRWRNTSSILMWILRTRQNWNWVCSVCCERPSVPPRRKLLCLNRFSTPRPPHFPCRHRMDSGAVTMCWKQTR